eukprot:gene12159-biopygen1178
MSQRIRNVPHALLEAADQARACNPRNHCGVWENGRCRRGMDGGGELARVLVDAAEQGMRGGNTFARI